MTYLDIEFQGKLHIIEKSETERIIGGYASLVMIDKDEDLITRNALEGALTKFMSKENEKYRNVMVIHKGIQVGEVIPSWKDAVGTEYNTKVDDNGLFVICKMRAGLKLVDDLWKQIVDGEYRSFSIGAHALEKEVICDVNNKCIKKIDEMDLYEVTICKIGKNQGARFTVLQKSESPCYGDVYQLAPLLHKDINNTGSNIDKLMPLTTPLPRPDDDTVGKSPSASSVELGDVLDLAERIMKLENSIEMVVEISKCSGSKLKDLTGGGGNLPARHLVHGVDRRTRPRISKKGKKLYTSWKHKMDELSKSPTGPLKMLQGEGPAMKHLRNEGDSPIDKSLKDLPEQKERLRPISPDEIQTTVKSIEEKMAKIKKRTDKYTDTGISLGRAMSEELERMRKQKKLKGRLKFIEEKMAKTKAKVYKGKVIGSRTKSKKKLSRPRAYSFKKHPNSYWQIFRD